LNDEYESYQALGGFDLLGELMGIIRALDDRKDPSYEASLRRTVPSKQQAHATRVTEVRKVVTDWLKSHRNLNVDDLLQLAEALWSTGWREERIAAVMLIGRHEGALDNTEWEQLRRWSEDVDNWEHIDHLAEVAASLLLKQPRLIGRIESLASSYNAWQRRLALVTLIIAGRDFAWELALNRMTERLKDDDDPAVKKALTWARREIAQREAKGG
jgi:3-methyladenine DNA glycosylase AlkD